MKFFEFYVDTFQWHAVLERRQMRKIFVPINSDKWVREEHLPVKMDLVDAYQDISQWEKDTPFADLIRWSSDFTIGGYEHKAGSFMIMTSIVKDLLEKHKLPPHRFYPLELHCKHYKEKKTNYYLFHMIGRGGYNDDFIDYSKCTFVEITRDSDNNKQIVKHYPEGTITSKVQYVEVGYGENTFLGTYKEKFPNGSENIKRNELEFVNKVYREDYDIFWGFSNLIYINEEVKKEITTQKITNAGFFEIPYNIIRPFEYQQKKNDKE